MASALKWNGASGLGLGAETEKLGKKSAGSAALAWGFGGFSAWGFPRQKIKFSNRSIIGQFQRQPFSNRSIIG